MKKGIASLSLILLFYGVSFAQTIQFEAASPAPMFQDADVGAMAFGDIDNDGDDDLIITGKGGPVQTTLYRNDGMGNFSEVLGAPFQDVFGGHVAFEDFDNDGKLDLLITGNSQGGSRTVNLYKNMGGGNYTLVNGTPFEPSWGGKFAFGDVDKDNDKDLILTGANAQDQGIAKLYLNNGAGVFSEVTGTPFEAVQNSSVAWIDMDNDQDIDLLITGENNNGIRVTKLYANDSTGNFTEVANTPFDPVDAGDIAIADTDNDGDQDVLISGRTTNSVTISKLYINDGTGTFSLLAGTPFPGTSVGATNFADFDNDGDMDVLIVGAGNAVVANIYENQGANNFILADSLQGAYLASTAIGDMDGDGDADLVIGGTSFQQPVRATKTYLNLTPIQTGIEGDDYVKKLRIYPNPSDGLLNIELSGSLISSVSIYSPTGKLLYSNDGVNAESNQIQIDQPAGLYIVVVRSKGTTTTHKLVLK